MQANYTNSVTKIATVGSPVVYTLSIPSTSTNKEGAIKYIQYLRDQNNTMSPTLNARLKRFSPKSKFFGNSSAVPKDLQF